MKLLITLLVATVVGFSTAQANEKQMKFVAKKLMNFDKLPSDYSMEKIDGIRINGTRFQTRLNTLTRQAVKKWERLLKTDEYDHLTAAQRREALANPAKYLGVSFLIEIQEVTAIYYKGELIGYKVETADHVQAAIYQDGAGIHFYLDTDKKVVAEDEWSA